MKRMAKGALATIAALMLLTVGGVLLTACDNKGNVQILEPYWVKVGEPFPGAYTNGVIKVAKEGLVCGSPIAAECWSKAIDQVYIRDGFDSETDKCLLGHAATGKYSHRNGYGHHGDGESHKIPGSGLTDKQWPFNGRYNCGDSLYL